MPRLSLAAAAVVEVVGVAVAVDEAVVCFPRLLVDWFWSDWA